MSRNEFYDELDKISGKYERLESLIEILQMFVSESVEIAGAPADSLDNALYEIAESIEETNTRFKSLISAEVVAV